MNEAWIALGNEQAAIRVTVKQLYGSQGIGICQLNVILELTCRKPLAAVTPVWLEGTMSVSNLGSHSGYLAKLMCRNLPITMHSVGVNKDLAFSADISSIQVQTIEEYRTNSVLFNFDFSGFCLINGSPEQIWGVQFEYEVNQSDWIALLDRVGYHRILLFELDAPDEKRSPEQATALRYFAEARKHYLEQEWRLTVESLRQTLSALVGKKPEEEEGEQELPPTLKELKKQVTLRKVGYQERYEPIRATLKFLSDLGAHPETEETRKQQAYSALLMVAGLLHGWLGN